MPPQTLPCASNLGRASLARAEETACVGPVCAITQTSLKGPSASLTNLSARDLVDFSVMNVEAAVWADVFVHRDGLEMPVNVPSAMNHVLTAKGASVMVVVCVNAVVVSVNTPDFHLAALVKQTSSNNWACVKPKGAAFSARPGTPAREKDRNVMNVPLKSSWWKSSKKIKT